MGIGYRLVEDDQYPLNQGDIRDVKKFETVNEAGCSPSKR
jgi:hypothetical protein